MKNDVVLSILQSNKYCTLSTVNEDGSPHGSPVFFVAHNDSIYWWSARDSQHSLNIERTGKVFITLFDSHAKEEDAKGVYIASDAEVVKEGFENILVLYNNKADVFELNFENVSGASPSRLYRATIKRVWLSASDKINGNYVDIREEVQ